MSISMHCEIPDALHQRFREVFGGQGTHAAWSPGRVNLIGEHTDYNLLPVLPMAIGRGFTFLARPCADRRVRFANEDPSYPVVDFEVAEEIESSPAGDWANYIKAGTRKLFPLITAARSGVCLGFEGVVTSSLPPASGLSSSSALVVGSMQLLAAVNGFRIDLLEAAEHARLAEHYVGTAGGGMDQAVIMLGRKGSALRIEFAPLRVHEVRLPDGGAYFAVNSLEHAQKAGKARLEYNRRVFECNAGLRIIARFLSETGVPAARLDCWQCLRDAYEYCLEQRMPATRLVLDAVGTEIWSMKRLGDALGSELASILAKKQLPPPESREWEAYGGFDLYGRLVHVMEETDRVSRCAAAFERGSLSDAAAEMNLSHASCRDLYRISTPGIEQLVYGARQCGALAARITGAGFGGCIVAMVGQADAAAFADRLWSEHFLPRMESGELPRVARDAVIIECPPADGARAWAIS